MPRVKMLGKDFDILFIFNLLKLNEEAAGLEL
jgi:hypothetical protein